MSTQTDDETLAEEPEDTEAAVVNMLLRYNDDVDPVDEPVCATAGVSGGVFCGACTHQIAKNAPNHSDLQANRNQRVLVLAELLFRLGPLVGVFVVDALLTGQYLLQQLLRAFPWFDRQLLFTTNGNLSCVTDLLKLGVHNAAHHCVCEYLWRYREAIHAVGGLGIAMLDVHGDPFAHALKMLRLLFDLKLLRPRGAFGCFAASHLYQCVGQGVRASHVTHNVMAEIGSLAAQNGWCSVPVSLGRDFGQGYSHTMQFYAVRLARVENRPM